ncbi:hypothetical protein B0H11DRAFT_1940830 [Mycena galericulata]|nr:hypothetical protein B0H11DRAFT_1940830 [Mycena galericulata]
MQGNSPNLCRDVVLYMPVWRAEWDWEHEVPLLVSEAEFLASLIARMGPTHYDEPYTWTPSLTSWGNTTLNQFGRMPAIVSLQRGESCYTDVKWESYLNLPFLALDYDGRKGRQLESCKSTMIFVVGEARRRVDDDGGGPRRGIDILVRGTERLGIQWEQTRGQQDNSLFPSHFAMPATLSEINEEVSDSDAEEEIDELAGDPDAASGISDAEMKDANPDENGDSGSDGNKSDATDSDTADVEDWLGRCDYCNLPLGHNTRVPSRVFRCRRCKSGLQCETCCHKIHVCKPEHPLEEWDPTADDGEPASWPRNSQNGYPSGLQNKTCEVVDDTTVVHE